MIGKKLFAATAVIVFAIANQVYADSCYEQQGCYPTSSCYPTNDCSNNCYARDPCSNDTNFYFGAELSFYNKTSYNGGNTHDLNLFKTANSDTKLAISKNEPGINIFGGLRIIQPLALEIGIGFISKVSAAVQNNQTATNKISNLYLDALGFLRVSPCIDLIGSVGMGGLKNMPNVTGATFNNKAQLTKVKLGYRFGGGAQYNYNENWATRAMVRYQSGNKNFLRGLTSISVGVVYTLT